MKSQEVKKPFRVAIEGNVGSGKSTFIKYFESFKDVETNPVSSSTYLIIDCIMFNLFCSCILTPLYYLV